MPRARKLELDDVEGKASGPRTQAAQAYDTLLANFAVGEYGEATVLTGEHRATVRNRLQAAAKRQGLVLLFRRTSGEAMVFKVAPAGTPRPRRRRRTQTPEIPAAPSTSPQPRGRPRAAAAATQTDTPARGRPRGASQSRYSDMLPRWMRERGDDAPPRRGGRNRR